VKLAADFERTSFDRGAPDGADRPAETLVLSRIQVAW